LRTAIYPGTFDPITNGHLDIALRAAELFDRVIIAVGENPNKKPLFSVEERKIMIREALAGLQQGRISVDSYRGLTIEYAQRVGAQAIVRGLRVLTDFEWEFQLAMINHRLAPQIETVCLMTAQEHLFLSATIVRELAQNRADLSAIVPANVSAALRRIYGPAEGMVLAGASDRSDI
jgi:pantetheine-phosphate adenylyltransferase